MKVEIIDYLIFSAFVLFLFYVGWRCKKQLSGLNDFLLIGQRLPGWVIALSLFSLGLSAFDVLGLSALTADHGIVSLHYFWLGSIPAIAFLVLVVIPVFRRSGTRSLTEYLGKRFDDNIRFLGSYLYMGLVAIFCSLNLYLGAKTLTYFIPAPTAVFAIVLCAIAIAYVCLGGLSAAILNSVLLVCMIVFAFLPLSILGLMHFLVLDKNMLPSLEKFQIELMNKNYYELWNPLFTHNTLGLKWDLIFTGLVLGLSLGIIALDYAVIQRLACLKDEDEAKKAALSSGFLRFMAPFFLVLPTLISVAVAPEMKNIAGDLDSPLCVLPTLIANWYPAGMLGIAMCAVAASVFCSVQASSMVVSSIYMIDLKTNLSDLKNARLITCISGVIFIVLAILISLFPGIANFVQTVFTFLGVPLAAVTVCGLLWPGSTAKGAKAGLVGGVIVAALHYFGSILSSIAPDLLPLGLGSIAAPLKSQLSYFAFRSVIASDFSRAFIVFIATMVITIGFSGKQVKDQEETERLTFNPASLFYTENRMTILSIIGLFLLMAFWNVALW